MCQIKKKSVRNRNHKKTVKNTEINSKRNAKAVFQQLPDIRRHKRIVRNHQIA